MIVDRKGMKIMRRLYHGSEKIIEKSIYGQGEKYNDYGLGFYCTDSIDMAKEWGVKKGTDGYANCYELDCNGLDILNLNDDQYCILHWLAILLQNREFDIPSRPALEAKGYILDKFSIDYERYDSIIGYRADNSYFSFAQDFIEFFIFILLYYQRRAETYEHYFKSESKNSSFTR